MKHVWLRTAALAMFALALLLPMTASAEEMMEIDDHGTFASFYLRSAGSSYTSLPVYPDPYGYTSISYTNNAGTGFELERSWNQKLGSHLRFDVDFLSGDEDSDRSGRDIYPDTTYSSETIEKGTSTRTDWSVSLDCLYEPFGKPMFGKVRTGIAVGPYLSFTSSNSDSDYERDRTSTSGAISRSSGTSTSSSFEYQMGLRTQFAAEYWLSPRFAFVCRTSFGLAWFSEDTEGTYKSDYYYDYLVDPPQTSRSQSENSSSESGWWMGMQGIIAGFKFQI